MTVAVCVKCGSIKHGAFNICEACGLLPESEIDLAYSLALTDHHFTAQTLHQISRDMKLGSPRPSLPPEQEHQLREAAKKAAKLFRGTAQAPPSSSTRAASGVAKFEGWDGDAMRSIPCSRLMWRAGFGWIAATLALVILVAAALLSGLAQAVVAVIGLVVVAFNIGRWRRWNREGWPQLHRRAMLLYSGFAGLETGNAARERREFDMENACRSLGFAMVTGKNKQTTIDDLVLDLSAQQGRYLGNIFRKFGRRANPVINDETTKDVAELLDRMKFGPQIMIGAIVQNTFGGEEAARYALELIRNNRL